MNIQSGNVYLMVLNTMVIHIPDHVHHIILPALLVEQDMVLGVLGVVTFTLAAVIVILVNQHTHIYIIN